MMLRGRLKRLEEAALSAAEQDRSDDWLTEEDWLVVFEGWQREGRFAAEPDSPAALAAYREALRQAAAQTDLPFDPPDDFLPGLADLPHLRLLNWRDRCRFPEVHAAWEWLAEISRHVLEGSPQVTPD